MNCGKSVAYFQDNLSLDVRTECPGVPRDILWPRCVGRPSADDTTARKLAEQVREKITKYASGIGAEIRAGRPA